jgi:putative membrane protein
MNTPAWADPYCGPAPSPQDLWLHWNLDPVILGGLLAGTLLLIWRRDRISSRTRWAAGLALLSFGVAFVSPLCALSTSLFAARTVHHIILICVAAPLVALTLPRPPRQAIGVTLIATALQTIVLWFWHAPILYAAALSSDAVYAVMELTLFASALLFWCTVRAASAPMAAFALVLTMVQMGMLGALLVFAEAPVYAPHALTTAAWGLTQLQDQQLAGLTMWAPAAGIYLIAALVLVARWIGPDRSPQSLPA